MLPIDTWRDIMGLHPWHFWGFADSGSNAIVPITDKCSGLLYEYDWQGSDAAGRQSIRDAIADAHTLMAGWLNYQPSPEYVDYATVQWPQYYQNNLIRGYNNQPDGGRVGVFAPEGYIQAMGVESLTLIGTATVLGGELVYSAEFNASLEDTFTITLPTTVTDPTTIAVYFSISDRFDDTEVSERWRIEPINVSISGGNVVITGRKWLLARPILYQSPVQNAAPLNPQIAGNFVTSLDVYERTTDQSGNSITTCQATLVYESSDCGGWADCCSNGTDGSSDPDTSGLVIARAGIRDRIAGIVTPGAATYNATTGLWSSAWACSAYCNPERVQLRYLAGYPLDSKGRIDRKFRDPLAWLAAAEAKRRICACRETNERLWQLQQDTTLQATETERYQIPQKQADNPFGNRRGHIQAWMAVKDLILVRGIAA